MTLQKNGVKKMLTKEECLNALEMIVFVEGYYNLEHMLSDEKCCSLKYKMMFDLINEHFDNPKISLEIETGDWIPCKERMPKDSRNVVITTSSNVVGVGSYLGNGWVQWYSGGGMVVDVLAWRELPKPYSEVQEDE